MTNKKLILIVPFFLVGCGVYDTNWRNYPEQYNCSSEQMERVEKETKFCFENGGFNRTYCYSAAIARICDKKPDIILNGIEPYINDCGLSPK